MQGPTHRLLSDQTTVSSQTNDQVPSSLFHVREEMGLLICRGCKMALKAWDSNMPPLLMDRLSSVSGNLLMPLALEKALPTDPACILGTGYSPPQAFDMQREAQKLLPTVGEASLSGQVNSPP